MMRSPASATVRHSVSTTRSLRPPRVMRSALGPPEPARFIVLGLILIALMILRPNGLLGERRVEIV